MFQVSSNKTGISFCVKVQPGAIRSEVAGVDGDFLKIRLTAAPVDGKANQALIELLARRLAVPKTCVKIRTGASSKRKIIQIENYSEEKFRNFLATL